MRFPILAFSYEIGSWAIFTRSEKVPKVKTFFEEFFDSETESRNNHSAKIDKKTFSLNLMVGFTDEFICRVYRDVKKGISLRWDWGREKKTSDR